MALRILQRLEQPNTQQEIERILPSLRIGDDRLCFLASYLLYTPNMPGETMFIRARAARRTREFDGVYLAPVLH